MYVCLFEDDIVRHLAPLTDTRAVYDLRTGPQTLGRQAARAIGASDILLHARPSVAEVSARENAALVNRIPGAIGVLFVNGRVVLTQGSAAAERIGSLAGADTPLLLESGGSVVAAWLPDASGMRLDAGPLGVEAFHPAGGGTVRSESIDEVPMVSRVWHLIDGIGEAIDDEFRHRARGYNIYERPGTTIHDTAVLEEGESIIVGTGATIRAGAIVDAGTGAVVIDDGATVFERAVIRGPAYIGPGSHVKIGAHLESVVIGPRCKVAGEIHDTIIHSCSNKAHDGFLGNAYIGRWCNLGAATNNSNLKNDYGNVHLYNVTTGVEEDTGRQFVGLFMGDHSKCSIGTTFNTGTVVGVACNLYGAGFHPRYVPSFSWGSPERYTTYRLEKALAVAERVMRRRQIEMGDADRELLRAAFEASTGDRDAFVRGA